MRVSLVNTCSDTALSMLRALQTQRATCVDGCFHAVVPGIEHRATSVTNGRHVTLAVQAMTAEMEGQDSIPTVDKKETSGHTYLQTFLNDWIFLEVRCILELYI